MSIFLLSVTVGNSFMAEASCQKTTSSDSFPQTGKFYTLAGRTFNWGSVGGKNVTTGNDEELYKWSVQDIVGDVVLVNRTMVIAHTYNQPGTGENYTDTYDLDYEIATNRTVLSAHQKYMRFDTTGFQWSSERPLGEDVGEHTWGWFPTDLHIGDYVLVGWIYDNNFLNDMLYEVVDEEVIQVIGQKQDCWIVRMPPSVNIDGTYVRTETYWVDKNIGVPLKLYEQAWALDSSSGFAVEHVLVHTNIDLGPESTEELSPTYTLTVPTTPDFPEAGKFHTSYYLEEGWYMSGPTNITYYNEGLCTIWVVNVIGDEALVHKILWFEQVSASGGLEELEAIGIQYYNYAINTDTREILNAAGSFYSINMTSLTYTGEDRTSLLAGDIGEQTYCWLPTNLNIGATINISWTHDRPTNVDNGTYAVIDQRVVTAFDKPQECWILYMPPTSSIDGTWNYSDTSYSDKDVGIPLADVEKGWAVDSSSAWVANVWLINTNVYLGPSTYVFQVVADSQTFNVTVVTNSTIPTQTFDFSQGEKEISFNVTGLSGTEGFCNITIPRTLMDCTDLNEWMIFANGTDISSICIKNRDTSYTYICIPYNHSVQPIVVKGRWVVPEFPAAIIMPLFMIATLLAVMIHRRRRIGIG
jgi:hypothetical protein